jgi:hypothetical protein
MKLRGSFFLLFSAFILMAPTVDAQHAGFGAAGIVAPPAPIVSSPVQPFVTSPVQPFVTSPVQPFVTSPVQPFVTSPVQPFVTSPVAPFGVPQTFSGHFMPGFAPTIPGPGFATNPNAVIFNPPGAATSGPLQTAPTPLGFPRR